MKRTDKSLREKVGSWADTSPQGERPKCRRQLSTINRELWSTTVASEFRSLRAEEASRVLELVCGTRDDSVTEALKIRSVCPLRLDRRRLRQLRRFVAENFSVEDRLLAAAAFFDAKADE